MVVDFNGSEKFVPEKNAGELSTKAGNKMMEEVTKCMGGGPGIKCGGAALDNMPVLSFSDNGSDAANGVKPVEKNPAARLVAEADLDGDKQLSRKEIEQWQADGDHKKGDNYLMGKALANFDAVADKDGMISIPELTAYNKDLRAANDGLHKQEHRSPLFDKIDADGNGQLTRQEIEQSLKNPQLNPKEGRIISAIGQKFDAISRGDDEISLKDLYVSLYGAQQHQRIKPMHAKPVEQLKPAERVKPVDPDRYLKGETEKK
ncbi:MAG TPA: hypothetical protein PKD05_04870 [Candidatus Melainabacteria bacterium]|nr:hypothetical protein [Candidatus Melainabacteria bacterium]